MGKLDDKSWIYYVERLGEARHEVGSGGAHLVEWYRTTFQMELHLEVASWTLERLCGVSLLAISDAGGFQSASICALTGCVRVGLAAGREAVAWHQEACEDRWWCDVGHAGDAAGGATWSVAVGNTATGTTRAVDCWR